jgi:CheY-specific phosphatase CheX
LSDFYKDVLIGTLFIIGLIGFISGEFIVSSMLFAAAAITSNLNPNRKRVKSAQFSWD